jgi:hypothetical protein
MTLTKQEIKFIANALPNRVEPNEKLQYVYVEPNEVGCRIFSTDTHRLHILDIVAEEDETFPEKGFYLDWRRLARDAAYSSDKLLTIDMLEDNVQMHGSVRFYGELQLLGEYGYLDKGVPINYLRVVPDVSDPQGGKTAMNWKYFKDASVLAGESKRVIIEQQAPSRPFLLSGEGRWRAVIMPMSVN